MAVLGAQERHDEKRVALGGGIPRETDGDPIPIVFDRIAGRDERVGDELEDLVDVEELEDAIVGLPNTTDILKDYKKISAQTKPERMKRTFLEVRIAIATKSLG